MKTKPFLLIITTLALLPSCSVLEDRHECPCILEINTSITQKGSVVDIAGFDENGRVLYDRFQRDSCPKRYEREVHRCSLSVTGLLSDGMNEHSDDGRVISIRRGMQADSIFSGVTRVDASGETASSTVSLHKQFTTINLFQEQEREDSGDYRVEVRGDCAGFDVLSLSSVRGEFFYETPFPAEGTSFRILRIDEESSIWVSIVDVESEETIRSFKISQLMKNAGYDCNALDLQDVEIYVSLASMDCLLSITEWSGNIVQLDI